MHYNALSCMSIFHISRCSFGVLQIVGFDQNIRTILSFISLSRVWLRGNFGSRFSLGTPRLAFSCKPNSILSCTLFAIYSQSPVNSPLHILLGKSIKVSTERNRNEGHCKEEFLEARFNFSLH